MALSRTRRGGLGGYIKGVLFGIVLVVLALAALGLVAPVEEPGLTTAGDPELAAAEPAPLADAEPGLGIAGQEVAPDAPAAGEEGVDIEGVGAEDAAVEPALENVDPALGEAGDEDTIRPVEIEGLAEAPPAGGAAEPGGADQIPAPLEEILEGQAETGDGPQLETDIGALIEAEEEAAPGADTDEDEGLTVAMPPPLPETRPVDLAGPALQVNAADYAAPGDEPVIGVIMDGIAGSELSPDVLFALPVPVTLGIVPGREGDQALADAARARNWEVLAQLPVAGEDGEAPAGALSGQMPPEEVAERTEALMGRLSQAVAAESGGALEDPEAVQALLAALEEHGFGYVGAGAAEGAGPPNAQPTTRVPQDASAEEVLAVLQEAVAAAGPGGAGLVVLPPTRAAAEALARWNAEAGAGRIAPLSAVIGRQAGG